MLISLFRLSLFLTIIMALAWGVSYLSGDQNKILGTTVIEISGFEYLISPIQLLILLGLIILGAWIFLKIVSLILAIFRFINGDETAVSRYFDRNRERKGFRALSEGMMALASGEGSAALSKAKKAEKYLKKPSLTNLLAAQAAEIAGEAEHAEEIYKTVNYLLKKPELISEQLKQVNKTIEELRSNTSSSNEASNVLLSYLR